MNVLHRKLNDRFFNLYTLKGFFSQLQFYKIYEIFFNKNLSFKRKYPLRYLKSKIYKWIICSTYKF